MTDKTTETKTTTEQTNKLLNSDIGGSQSRHDDKFLNLNTKESENK